MHVLNSNPSKTPHIVHRNLVLSALRHSASGAIDLSPS